MHNNTFGNFFNITTFGESHGNAIGVIIDGVPSGIELSNHYIQELLDKRKPGVKNFTSPRKENDIVEILSGIFEGKTLGTPLALLIKNIDAKSSDYNSIKEKFRPNHGDYTWQQKFGIRDYRGGGRSSARETAVRVAAGAVAKKILTYQNIKIYSALIQIGSLKINYSNWSYAEIDNNIFYSPDKDIISSWKNLLQSIQEKGDSIGAKIEIHIKNVPVGLGEPTFNKLDAELAKAIMSIPAVKSVEIGIGNDAVYKKGSEISDEMYLKDNQPSFKSNYSGGIQGGISNGNDIIIKFTVKAASSIQIEKTTLDQNMNPTSIITHGRHDPCIGIRAVIVGQAMASIVMADYLLLHRARHNYILM